MTIVLQNSPCPPSRWTWAFLCAVKPIVRLAAALPLLLNLLQAAGCGRGPHAELPLHVQIAEVDRGTRETIEVEAVALGDADLESLAYVNNVQALLFDNADSEFSAAGLQNLGRL